jgi:hypothetical protein
MNQRVQFAAGYLRLENGSFARDCDFGNSTVTPQHRLFLGTLAGDEYSVKGMPGRAAPDTEACFNSSLIFRVLRVTFGICC